MTQFASQVFFLSARGPGSSPAAGPGLELFPAPPRAEGTTTQPRPNEFVHTTTTWAFCWKQEVRKETKKTKKAKKKKKKEKRKNGKRNTKPTRREDNFRGDGQDINSS